MLIYAGIDEAGYGPMFGPFVVSRSVFALEDFNGESAPPVLWTLLKKAVCRVPTDKRRRVAVNDSKKLYTPSGGLSHLERGVLAFLSLLDRPIARLDDLLTHIGTDDECRTPDTLWYADADGGPALPTLCTEGQIAIARNMIRRCCDETKVRLLDVRAAVIYERRFNEIIEATNSKAACGWQFVSEHLRYVWEQHGEHRPWAVVDRQGGRKVYSDLLAQLFPDAQVRLMDESDDISRYLIVGDGRSMIVSFEVGSEDVHMPVALASMTAKYLRELLMHRFNRFFQQHEPALKATAGYYGDGQRFLEEIEPLISRLNIDRAMLIRSR
jgi:ribonuclease HII